ncbi:MAG: hypothetical protein GC178_17415 [Flavobacteriales bacterium]|nr:hypothetical protein [Flavobacteriales bacterium]
MRSLTLALVLFSSIAFAQKKIEVVEKTVTIDGKDRNCLTVSIKGADVEEVKKAWKKQLKDLKGKVDDKTIIFGDDCKDKSMGDNTFDVYSIVEATIDTSVRLSAAFDLGGADLNSTDHPEKYLAATKIVHDFGVDQAKAVVQGKIDDDQKLLKGLEKDLNGLEKDKEKAEKDIQDNKDKIIANKEAIAGNISDQKAKQSEKNRLEQGQIEKPSDEVAKVIKDYEKELDKMVKDKKRLEKDNEKLEEKIKESQAAIKQNEKDQDAKKAEIDEMKKAIHNLEFKLKEIL